MMTFAQRTSEESPWSVRERLGMLAWEFCWALFCVWTPKPLNRWRLAWLRLFGAEIQGQPFVHQRARIQIPWHLSLQDRACLGDRTHIYNLARITIGERAVVAQEAYLCAGTHDLSQPHRPLQVAAIRVAADVFIGARAFVLPGRTIGARAVVGACAVVTRDIAPGVLVVGNPARPLRAREECDGATEDRTGIAVLAGK